MKPISSITYNWLFTALAILLLGLDTSYAQQSMKMFAARTFYEDNGLISNQINASTQSSMGELWFGTPKGISTFDGIRWKQVKGSDGFPVHTSSMLIALPGDSVLQMGYGLDSKPAIRFYHGNTITDIDVTSQQLPQNAKPHVFNGAVLEQGKKLQIAFQVQEEVWVLQLPQNRWQKLKLPEELSPTAVTGLIYFQQSLLVLSTKGLYSYQAASKEFRPLWPSQLKDKILVSATPSADGNSLYLLGNNWLAVWKDNRLQFLQEGLSKKNKSFSTNKQYTIVATQSGLLIFQLDNELYVLNPKTGFLEPFRLSDSFSTSIPTSIIEDVEGNLWFSTHRGVAMLNSLRFATMDKFVGLPDQEISTIFELDSSTVLLGSNLGVSILQNYQWAKKASGELIFSNAQNRIMDVARLDDQQLLIAGNEQGLGILNQANWSIRWHPLPDGLMASSVALWQGRVVVSAGLGKVLVFNQGTFTPLIDLGPYTYIRKITIDKADRVVLLTTKGLYRYNGSSTEQLKSDSPNYSNIYSLLQWNGRTLLGTSNGLAILLGDKIVPLKDSIPMDRPVYALLADKQQQLWMGTDQGIFVYKQGNIANYSRYNGLAGREVNRHALTQMKDGRIWIGTDKGLSIYDPHYDFKRTIVPRLHLNDIKANERLLGKAEHHRVRHDENTLEFTFKGLSFYYPEALEYRYRLDGFEKYWTLSDNYLQNSVRFTNLPAGSYKFALQARVQNGPWSPVAYSNTVTIAPPFWGSWWFIGALVLAMVLIGYAIRSLVSFRSSQSYLKTAIAEKISQIEQSESKFEAIWESMDTGVVIATRSASILMANPAFRRLFEQREESPVGKDISSLVEHSRFSKSSLEEWYKNPAILRFELELRKDGVPAYMLVTFAPLDKLMPNATLLMIGLKDISDQKEAEIKNLRLNELLVRQNRDLVKKELELASFNFELLKRQDELQDALKVLEERNFELDQFVYKTSHDLRSPIASSLGLLNIMKMEGLSPSWPGYVDMIMRSLQKQDSFIKAMLNFSKTARADEKPELIDFKILVEQCLSDLQYLPGFDEITKEVRIRDENGDFYSDKMKINIILSNIISNSVKYRDAGKASSMAISIETDRHQANILVSDNGIGINENYLAHVFEMFYRATDRSDGSGLGLYIVKQTVERLGGKIEVSSELGTGSCFKISIPNLASKRKIPAGEFMLPESGE